MLSGLSFAFSSGTPCSAAHPYHFPCSLFSGRPDWQQFTQTLHETPSPNFFGGLLAPLPKSYPCPVCPYVTLPNLMPCAPCTSQRQHCYPVSTHLLSHINCLPQSARKYLSAPSLTCTLGGCCRFSATRACRARVPIGVSSQPAGAQGAGIWNRSVLQPASPAPKPPPLVAVCVDPTGRRPASAALCTPGSTGAAHVSDFFPPFPWPLRPPAAAALGWHSGLRWQLPGGVHTPRTCTLPHHPALFLVARAAAGHPANRPAQALPCLCSRFLPLVLHAPLLTSEPVLPFSPSV